MSHGNRVLDRLLDSGTIPLEDGAAVTLRHPEFPESLSHIDRDSGALLQRLIAEQRPQRTLEVGLAYGISTLFICDALQALGPRARHIVIDPFQHGKWRGLGLRNLAQAGYADLIDFRDQPSELVLPQLLAERQTFDFVFIDALHRFDQVMVEFYYVNRLLNPGGIVVFDDANRRSVGRAIRHALTYPCYQVHAANGAPPPSRSWRAAVRRRAASFSAAQRLLRPDVLARDWDLGIGGRAVALCKTGEDTRHTYFDAEF